MNKISVIIVAAGKGLRAKANETNLLMENRQASLPKQYQSLAGRPLLDHTISIFKDHPLIDQIIIVIGAEDDGLFKQYCPEHSAIKRVIGGANRRDSVLAGLESLKQQASPPEYVLIHDAARPLLSKQLLDRLIASMVIKGSAIPLLAIQDAIKKLHPNKEFIEQRLDRNLLYRAQTPQCFRLNEIYQAHLHQPADSPAEDDASLMELEGHKLAWIEGEAQNLKITQASDFKLAEFYRSANHPNHSPHAGKMAIGHGYDLHRLIPKDNTASPHKEVILCGIAIPSPYYLLGHSDADCGLHALTDALLATIAAGDIGDHFPPSDPQWKGCNSEVFLNHALSLVQAKGAKIQNIDLTILAETPKIAPYRQEMRTHLASLLGLTLAQISIKATTMEGMDAIGQKQAIACHALVLVQF